MTPAIRVENLGKSYRVGRAAARGGYKTLRESLVDAAQAPFRRFRNRPENSRDEEFWALKRVDFEVQPGEVVGIIGRNGAGKSTLLKILSRITKPTTGQVELHGRVGSLLEVGTGFHPELTGRENIYLNGSILGMKRSEIGRRFDEIVAFAEVEKFLDTPVKRYSSGMYVRLAFAVAAHLEPEILIVDEVLAVGDAQFQNKCLSKMGDVSRSGRTVLFVSHNTAAITNLCERVIVLSRGLIEYEGRASEGLKFYTASATSQINSELDLKDHPARRRGCLPLLKGVRLLNDTNEVRDRFFSGESMTIELSYDPIIPLSNPQFGIGFDDSIGTRIFSLATFLSDSKLPQIDKPSRIICKIEKLCLTPGRYLLSLSAGVNEQPLMDDLCQVIAFDVEPGDFYGNGRVASRDLGVVHVLSKWQRISQDIDDTLY